MVTKSLVMMMCVLQVTASTPAQIQLRYDSLYPSISFVRSLRLQAPHTPTHKAHILQYIYSLTVVQLCADES